jgi:choline transporter-like protein 2/4/5
MRFINKNAYIVTALYSYSFMSSSKKAFFLVLRNVLRVAAANMVAGFLLILGLVF